MQPSFALSRRDLLQRAAGTALAAGLSTAATPCVAALAAPKTTRCTVSCRDLVLKDVGKPDCWSAIQELGVGGVELALNDDLGCFNLFHPQKQYTLGTPDGVKQLQDDLAANHAVVTAVGFFNRGSEWRIKRDLAVSRQLVPVLQQMGVKVIRIDVQARKITGEEFLPSAIQTCKQFCQIAEGTEVIFGVENHSKNTNDPAFLGKLFEGVNSKHIGLTLDANNFYWFGWPLRDVYRYSETFAPRVVHTHCKSVSYPPSQRNVRRQPDKSYLQHSVPIYAGDIDYRRVAAILHRANYQNDLCLENECLHHFPPQQHLGILKKEIALLKSLA
jgi:sugar phosphate isomerase/epimerase